MVLHMPDAPIKVTERTKGDMLVEIARLELEFGTFEDLLVKSEADSLTVPERIAFLRLDGLRFLAQIDS